MNKSILLGLPRRLERRLFNRAAVALQSNPPSVLERAQARIRHLDAATNSPSPQLKDTFNRQHNYLRISLTERCNLRCFYCMPEEGIELSPDGKLLTNQEILRLATLFVKSGVTKIRLTGGEPTIRKGILDIVGDLNGLRQYGLQSIGMTSNGLSLHRRLPQLVESGLTHLNLSLDTLDPFKFELITRRRGHEAVLKTLDVALKLPLASIKVNVVVIKNLNDHEVLDFVEMTKNMPISVRFIEFMPFTGNKWDKKKMVESSDLLERIRSRHPNVQRAPDELNDTARSWTVPGHTGSFGFISSMSDHFCATCNRLRLTADGQIKVCLFDAKEISLRDKIREGMTDEELLRTIGLAVNGKKEKHAGMEDIDVVTNRPMILIGGIRTKSNTFSTHSLSTDLHRRPSPFYLPHTQGRLHYRLYSTSRLTHLDEHGRASMVDVSDKAPSRRSATASGIIQIPKLAYELITSSYPVEEAPIIDRQVLDDTQSKALAKARKKGDALTIAQLAGIMGAKQTSNLIPLCHPLPLTKVDVLLQPEATSLSPRVYSIRCTATTTCEGKTGVEMEALTAVSVSLLTVWDMLKAVAGKDMEIGSITVTRKSGGKSGDFDRMPSSDALR
ncbi:hypothetical protein CPB83DRAFT_848068 [Crepidotus variabilis]|uniref:Radical SAM core domain-containing protein n=1 Tax=Crepidotus variabilis TaxID=179855 RepID=A0A9P6EN25_9AGAR|nr:hypothetical protein CPB83DRAFT_848068 [Crepidotus variabilis]